MVMGIVVPEQRQPSSSSLQSSIAATTTNIVVVVAFAAGALSASLVWVALSNNGLFVDGIDDDDDDDDDDEDDDDVDNGSDEQGQRKGKNGSSSGKRRRIRWPWESFTRSRRRRLRRRSSSASEASTLLENPVGPDDKTGLCIGSIFGMDIGGTLCKLVYFEERQPTAQPGTSSTEEVPVDTDNRRLAFQKEPAVDANSLSGSPVDSAIPTQNDHDPKQPQQQGPQEPARRNSFRNIFSILKEQQQVSNHRRTKSDGDNLGGSINTQGATTVDSNGALRFGNNGTRSDPRSVNDTKEALDHFYGFARRLNTYQMGVKGDNIGFYSEALGGDFHFLQFETTKMGEAMELFRSNNLHLNIREMGATGGGAHKFADTMERGLGIKMVKQEELGSLVAGMQFALQTVPGECYTFRPRSSVEDVVLETAAMTTSTASADASRSPSPHNNEQTKNDQKTTKNDAANADNTDHQDGKSGTSPSNNKDQHTTDDWWWSRKVHRDLQQSKSPFPYLLVTIGTGVSILRVDGPRQHERISGSTIGGGTYWGLIRLLTDNDDFDTVMTLAEKGDPTKVDMMVGDIYGNNPEALTKLGLPSNIVASSFGKLVAKPDPASGLKQEDLARALLLMVTNNIGQVAYLNAQLHQISSIYFVGNFLRRNKISQRRLAYAINYWSKGKMEALFLEHEGYYGALGAFLLSQSITLDDNTTPPAQTPSQPQAQPPQQHLDTNGFSSVSSPISSPPSSPSSSHSHLPTQNHDDNNANTNTTDNPSARDTDPQPSQPIPIL